MKAHTQAKKDISIYIGNFRPTHNNIGMPEVWNVRLAHVFNNHSHRLNKALGIK